MVYIKIAFQYLIVFVAILVINFALPRLAPGDPAIYLVGSIDIEFMTDSQKMGVLHEFGLDLPLVQQFKNYIAGIFVGDWGISTVYGQPVFEVVLGKLPWTLLLTGTALLLSTVIGTMAGVMSAWKRGEKKDVGTLIFVMMLSSIPSFWTAMLLITFFSAHLNLLPSFGAYSITVQAGTCKYVQSVIIHLILPVATLTLVKTGAVFLTARSAMLMTMEEDYITLAHAKGLKESLVIYKHALRNALLPIYTNIMSALGAMIGGATVIENVFSYPGLGSVIKESVSARDYSLLQGSFLLVSVSILFFNFVADLGYPLLDPRIKKMSERQ